jgi:hypothetical protein
MWSKQPLDVTHHRCAKHPINCTHPCWWKYWNGKDSSRVHDRWKSHGQCFVIWWRPRARSRRRPERQQQGHSACRPNHCRPRHGRSRLRRRSVSIQRKRWCLRSVSRRRPERPRCDLRGGCEHVSGEGCNVYAPGVGSARLAPFGWIPSIPISRARVVCESREAAGIRAHMAADWACMVMWSYA